MHLYLGLFVGAVLAVVGLTGSILVFYEESQEWLNAEQIRIDAPPEPKPAHSLDAIVAAAEAVKPPGGRFFKVYYPRNERLAYKLLYFQPPTDTRAAESEGDGYYIFVDPYTAKATGMQLWHPAGSHFARPLISFVMQLHYCLLLDTPGLIFVGLVGALAIVSVMTGLIVWWPLTGKFRQALSFKRQAGSVRFNFDLHKITGIHSSVALLVLLFSGVYFNLPDEVNWVVGRFSNLTRPNAWEGIDGDGLHSTFRPGHRPIEYATVEAVINRGYPSGRFWMLNAPVDAEDLYRVAKRDAEELNPFMIGYRDFAVDQYSGEILKVYEAGQGSTGDVMMDWQWPLHSGQGFGWPGRIMVFFAGLACPLLYVTGFIRWRQKRRASRFIHASYKSSERAQSEGNGSGQCVK